MEDSHLIYVDRLAGEKIEKIDCILSPEFMDIQEKDLSYPEEIRASGEAYVASDHLVIHLDVHTVAKLPCKTCNEPIKKHIDLTHVYHTVPIADMKQPIFDLRVVLRENILLESPQFAECEDAQCPNRVQYKEYFNDKDGATQIPQNDPSNYPFAYLDEEIKKHSTKKIME